MTGYRSVRNAFQVVPALHVSHRNIHKIHGTAAAVANGKVGAEDIRTVDLQEKIKEAGPQVKGAFPGTVPDGRKGKERTETVHDHFTGIFGDDPEMHFSVREYFSELLSVPARFSGIGIKGNGNIQGPGLFHSNNPPVCVFGCILILSVQIVKNPEQNVKSDTDGEKPKMIQK